MKIVIAFATETGNAETLAEDLESELAGGHAVTVVNIADFDPAAQKADLLLVLTSTYGDGELPATAQSFCDRIGDSGEALSGQRFTVFGLGNRKYGHTFAAASHLLEQRLLAHGAVRVCERGVHDASGGEFMDDLAKKWCQRAIALTQAQNPSASQGETQ